MQLCLPQLPRVITAELWKARLKRSDFFLSLSLFAFGLNVLPITLSESVSLGVTVRLFSSNNKSVHMHVLLLKYGILIFFFLTPGALKTR